MLYTRQIKGAINRTGMQVTDKRLQAAMKKAIEHGLVPRSLARDAYFPNLKALTDILQAALVTLDETPEADKSAQATKK